MVSRVDKKPIIYNTTLLRVLRPAVVGLRRGVLDSILSKSVGQHVPEVSSRELLDDYEDIEYAYKVFGVDEPAYKLFSLIDDNEDDECIRIARTCLAKRKTIRNMMKNVGMMEDISRIQAELFSDVEQCFYGTEAVYMLYNLAIWNNVFVQTKAPNYAGWCVDTAKAILLAQSTYLLIHPTATNAMCNEMAKDIDYRVWGAWNMYKQLETLAVRLGSRKNMLAHAYYAGVSKKGFTPADRPLDDFHIPTTGYAQTHDHVSLHLILGLRYFTVGKQMFVLSHDDCINLAVMAQCYFRTALYFQKSNGYAGTTIDKAVSLVKDISAHCSRVICAKKNFANTLRSMHIMAQGEFNNSFEEVMGTDLGWATRAANYLAEAKSLDPMGVTFHNRAIGLAKDNIDKLNTCFIYHAFIGDEMLISDLRDKVQNMTLKVRPVNQPDWDDFLKFVKAYTLCRFMMVHKKKPKCAGDIVLLNSKWADRCVAGTFTMPPHSEWGKVWISGELRYTEFADTWYLDAQDVSYVVKDSDGVAKGKYWEDRIIHSELLMAMAHGHILDTLTGSTPQSARERICKNEFPREVVVTTAPKAENAKPSWKKRVTFAADCEFRKMQAEYDRNCRKIMGFIRGPSLGVDQCILEKQFADICSATSTGLEGAICSHDISSWSESMDRDRKFEFEKIIIDMFDMPKMINIKNDWSRIKGVVNKQGCNDVIDIPNCSFQGFDGSASTLLHSFILIYCIDTARRRNIMPVSVKTNMATMIDDCIALMVDLSKQSDATNFWEHLKEMYSNLGFEVDELKSVFSTIKAIYLSRRFLLGGEVPSDLKVFLKAHSSYEDPLRCSLDVPGDIFGALRGAADANGDSWFIYFQACLSTLAELAHSNNCILRIHSPAAAIYALAPLVENGWGFPSIMSWATNDVTDKRSHFNAMLELNSVHASQSDEFQAGVDVYTRHAAKAIYAIKSQAWRIVSYSNIFTNPFEAIREGPLKPDMLKRNAVQDMLKEVAVAQPWKSLLEWHSSSVTCRVREMLVQSGPLHAPTLSALVNCMPDNYRLSMVGKAVGSESLLSLLTTGMKVLLKRRVQKCSAAYFEYSAACYSSTNRGYDKGDMASLTYIERTQMERDEFYAANGVHMTDHTFPDPVANFTVSATVTGSVFSPNMSSLRIWDKTARVATCVNQLISDRGIYVPRRSGRVWEVTCEYAKGWDTVSQRIAMGLAILARAEADGHKTAGLLVYFVKAWNELSNITPEDTHLISIHGSIKRLDANPGSATHPIITHRNIARGFNNKFKTALDAIQVECQKTVGSPAHLHDFLAHETGMTVLCVLVFSVFQFLGITDSSISYHVCTRQGCIVPESPERMKTDSVANFISIEIMDGGENYGLLQACPELAYEIIVPTMKASWVRMINALVDRDLDTINTLRKEMFSTSPEEAMEAIKQDEVYYSPSVILSEEPAQRRVFHPDEVKRVTIAPTPEASSSMGDIYVQSVKTVASKFTRTLTAHQPRHIVAATAVRSIIWSRLKTDSVTLLSHILYQDPEADYSMIKRCSTTDFWRGIVSEINKVRAEVPLSEITMSAFRSLGVTGIHIAHSNDTAEVCQSVASFFGAHLRHVVLIVSDLVCSIAGRSSRDFEKPFTERIVTNNPAVANAAMRKDHLNSLINHNIRALTERIENLLAGTATHRGDIRALDKHGRIVELRCRKYVYLSCESDDSGNGSVSGIKFAQTIHKCAERVRDKVIQYLKEQSGGDCPAIVLPDEPASFEGALAYMFECDLLFNKHCKKTVHGWDAESGDIGARLAYSTYMLDVNMVAHTRFAVSAAEVAPRIHKRVIVTPMEVPSVGPVETVHTAMFGDDDDSDGIDPFADEDIDFGKLFIGGARGLAIPLWQALYSLLLFGMYSPEEVNAAIGTCMEGQCTVTSLREAHLEDFLDHDLRTKLPKLESDYLGSGLVFDKEWLERDEADAYTTDELHTLRKGFLF